MKSQEEEKCWEDIKSLWPKKQGEFYWAKDRMAFIKRVKSSEDFEKLKNHIECLLEDNPVSKLPCLCDIINGLFKNKKQESVVEINNKPVLDPQEFYQKTNDPELIKVFTKIWEVWPRSPDFVERRSVALDAFLATAKVLPLADIETACVAYASAFNDGSMIYPKSLRGMLADKELLQEWLERGNSPKKYETERKQFEAAYSWYPPFSGKNTNKTKEASWVTYWRVVRVEEKLDFLATVKLYRRQRKADIYSSDQSEEEGVNYTKTFVNFVGEWKQLFSGNRLTEAKGDIFAYQVNAFVKDAGIDTDNIWGVDDISPFFVRVLMYLVSTTGNIKNAIREGLVRTVNIVNETKNDPKKINDIRDLEKAIKEIENLNVDKMTEELYKRVIELKSFEMPQEVKNDQG